MNAEQEKNTERYLSTGDLMDILTISRSTVYRLMAKGMPNIMIGSVHRFPMDQVITWLEQQNATRGISENHSDGRNRG
jgi:excisionase family DNA binding protein